jgi:hypothetical protein
MVSKRSSRKRRSITPKKVLDSAISSIPKIQSLFYNRNYLYFISLFSIIYFLGHAINQEYVSLVVFMITAIFTYISYSKNMSVVLTMSCIATIFLTSIYLGNVTTPAYTKEGMTSKNTKSIKNNKPVNKPTQPPKRQTEKLTPLQPASFQKNKRGGDFDVDLASTLEQSYGMLNNLLDNDGISNLTDETKRLIGEQKKLFQSMNSMAPLIGQAKEMLGMFNTNDFKQMEGLAQSTMKNLGEKKEQPNVVEGLQKKVVEGLQKKVNYG